MVHAAPIENKDENIDTRGTGTDRTVKFNNKLVRNIGHTTIHSSRQRGRVGYGWELEGLWEWGVFR